MTNTPKLQHYKGIWYGITTKLIKGEMWVISSTEDMKQNVGYYSTKNFRLDQAIEEFRKQVMGYYNRKK